MLTTRMRWSIAPCAALVLLLGGCTAADDDGPGQDGGSPTTKSPEPAEPDGPPEYTGPEQISIAMSGDVLLHTGTWTTAEADAAAAGRRGLDFRPMFEPMKPVISAADLAICHMETPLAEPEGPFENYPLFSSPPQVLDGLVEAGYDMCTTASNHTVDKGFEGLVRTIDSLREAGLPHSGSAKTRRASRRTPFVDVDGIKVSVLSYTYGTNGMPVEHPWSVNLIDPDRIKRDAAVATKRGAELVLVALHDGTEYAEDPTTQQIDVVDEITRSRHIDLVYGHHAHVSQPIDVVNGTWVAYGLGNFMAQQSTDQPATYRGTTTTFRFARDETGEWEVDRARFVPTQITREGEYAAGMRVVPAAAALKDPQTSDALRTKLEATVDAVRAVTFKLGARKHGLRMGLH